MPLVVDTRSGRVRGRLDRGVTAFRGIPYARPPLGALRLRPPAPAEPWPGVRDCGDPAPAAPQNASRFAALLGERAEKQSEDCLALDLWTAGFDGVPRPVLVFVHGGGFQEGSTGEPCIRGRRLARGGDLVVVSLQYRLGALGFFAPNLGLLDLLAGLEWVRDEIDAFGGDPARVTLFGHGAGATAVGCLMAMPAARPLCQRAILASGRYEVDSLERAEARRAAFLRALELLPRDGAKLAGLPLADLLAAQRHAGGFRPVVDGERLPRAPLDPAGAPEGPGVPLLIGTARDESRVLDLIEPGLTRLGREDLVTRLAAEGVSPELAAEAVEHDHRASPHALFHRVATELLYRAPAQRLADQAAERGAPVFQYRFDLSGATGLGDTGAFHGLDLPLVFGTRRITPLGRFFESVPEAKPVGRRMRDAFAAFATTGAPRSPLVGAWPRHSPSDRAVFAFSALE
ncbi:MAG TPA: carboxylesterase family protein [Myxococcota bacterium]|nr:carboxylesterase family protein [Myxococcota bacterium]